MFNKQQRSALEDYEETALMMRYNKLQRLCDEIIVLYNFITSYRFYA